MDSREIIDFISKSEKKTPVSAYITGNISTVPENTFFKQFKGENFLLAIDECRKIESFVKENREIKISHMEISRRNSAVPLADYRQYNARIEPGVFIREKVNIGDNCVIMMGAVINIGAEIGKETMIDMNVVIGGRAQIGQNCHIGAGTVVAGVIEPPSAQPVVIEDNVLTGANAVVLEGVRIGKGSVVAAGAVVTSDVEPGNVVAGVPARVVKKVDSATKSKTSIVDALRKL